MPTSHGDELDPIIRLNNETFDVTVYDEDDDIKDITNDTLIFEARLKVSDESPLIEKTSDDEDEIEKVDATNGIARVHIKPTDTQPLTKSRLLYCSLTDIDVAGRESSILFTVPVEFRA
jgi:hypothetical protein